ncbi:hypothetical protein C8R42DRAFT_686069 [Lentinula raphanica]|nr:hypothetical protein C8R42DRAFT_686069 [Lentinula raphanica]
MLRVAMSEVVELCLATFSDFRVASAQTLRRQTILNRVSLLSRSWTSNLDVRIKATWNRVEPDEDSNTIQQCSSFTRSWTSMFVSTRFVEHRGTRRNW